MVVLTDNLLKFRYVSPPSSDKYLPKNFDIVFNDIKNALILIEFFANQ